MWYLPLDSLTDDQRIAVEESVGTERNRVIVGPPGSGKTLVLLHRLLRSEAHRAKRARLIVRNRAMVHYVQSGLKAAGLDSSAIETADSLVLSLFRRFVKTTLPRNWLHELDWAKIRSDTLAAIVKIKPSPLLDACFVDEAQDIPIDTLKILKRVCGHVTVAMDPSQALYEDGSGVEDVRAALGTYEKHITLLRSYRCTPRIVELAAAFLPADEATAFRSLHLLPTTGNETPQIYFSESFDDEIAALAQELKNRSAENYTCAVLLPSRSQVDDVAGALRKAGVQVSEDLDSEFDDLIPEVLTYHQAKGISVDAVFLPQLTENGFYTFRTRSTEIINRTIFVGITRASKWVWMGTRRGEELRRSSLRRAFRLGRVRLKGPASSDNGLITTAPQADAKDPMNWVF